MHPPDFNAIHAHRWDEWVAKNGLPKLPAIIELGDSVPVSYCINGSRLAVLHLCYANTEESGHDPEVALESDVHLYFRNMNEWVPCGSGGGSLPATYRYLDKLEGVSSLVGVTVGVVGDDGCIALWGPLEADGIVASITQADETTVVHFSMPTGLAVLCGNPFVEMTIDLFDRNNRRLYRLYEPAAF